MMKKIFIFMVLGAMMGNVLVSCSEKKKTDVIITKKPVAPKPKGTQKMSNYEQTRDANWLGANYKVVVKREADTTLPQVQSDAHTKYYDNKITVRVLRPDGTEFFNHVFSKAEFESYLDANTKQNGALLGVVFVKAAGDYLHFAASVGSPDITSDEYVPLVVKISRMGALSISKDSQLDTDGDDEKAPSDEDEADEI